MTRAVYPGRFDPVNLGHLDIMHRASGLFDSVVVAVFEQPEREPLFSAGERMSMIRDATSGMANVTVTTFDGLIVEFVRAQGAQVIVRGLRKNADFEHEFEMALMNRRLAPEIDVACLITDLQYQFVRSSLVREVARLGGAIDGLVPPNVIAPLRRRLGERE